MKTTIKLSLALAAAILVFAQAANAQVSGNSYAGGDRNQGDLDKLQQSVGVTINLETILQLNGPKDANVAFIFDEIEEFKKGIRGEDPTMNGLYKSAGVTNGVQNFSVAATELFK